MSHDTEISPRAMIQATGREAHTGPAGPTGALAAPGSPSAVGLEQQRRALQGRVAALRQRGALPAAGQPASAVQWNNWSNG